MKLKSRQKACLTALTLLFLSSTAYADNSIPDSFALDEVVVTATRTETDRKDTPSAVQVITRKTIEEQGAQTLKDVLRYAVGVNLVRSSTSTTREAISIRGFDSRFSMILIDGKRVSSEIDQNYELDRISLDNIERIEIVRGPVSSLYGTEALGGVINIITRRSQKQSFTLEGDSAILGGGNNGRENYGFAYDSGSIGKLAFRLSGSQHENDAAFKSTGLTFSPYGTRKNLNAVFDYFLSDRETVSMTKSYAKEATYEYTKPAAAVLKSRDEIERNEYSLSYDTKSDDQELHLRFYQSIMDKKLDQYNAASQALANWVRAKRTVNVYEGRFTRQLNDKHRLTLGTEYRPEEFRGTAVATGEGLFTAIHPSGASKMGSTAYLDYIAAYAQDEWKLSDKLLAVVSLRYDDSNKFESSISPKLGLTYKTDQYTRVKFNAAKGFRSPTPNQLYQSAATQQGNPNLQSETSKSYDLSIEQEWGQKTGKLTFFHNKISNMIDLVNIGGTNQQYQNISKATIQGIEAEFSYGLTDRLAWSNAYTYLAAINDGTQQRLENRARHVLTSGLVYRAPRDFTASLQAQAYGSYLASPGGEKSYTLWNLAMSKKLSANYRMTVGVDNIFGKEDEDIPLTGRYIHGSIQVSF